MPILKGTGCCAAAGTAAIAVSARVNIISIAALDRFRIRFFGTQLVQWAGRDYTGSVIDEGATGLERLVFDDYSYVIETRQPRYDERSAAWPGRGYHRLEWIVAPLSSDGKTVDMLFGAIDVHPSN